MLSVANKPIMLSVIMLNVVVPYWRHGIRHDDTQHNDIKHTRLSLKGLYVTPSISDIQHNNAPLSLWLRLFMIMLSVVMRSVVVPFY
jgi:hypothetical protein